MECVHYGYLPAIKLGRFMGWKLISQRKLRCYLRSNVGSILAHHYEL